MDAERHPAIADLVDRLPDRVETGRALATLTTLRVGGPALAMVTAEADGDLAVVGEVSQDHHLPVLVVGRGSNLVVDDEGWPGIALQLGRGFRGVEVDASTVVAGAAEPLPALAAAIARAGLAGFAWGTAVPGTLGGAVRMNAGAHGSDMSEVLVEVEVYRLARRAREVWPLEALGLAYRHSELPRDAVVVGATLDLPVGDAETVRAEMAEIRRWRRAHQPLNEPNCGSVFTNPADDSAGRLVELAGAKGLQVGDAQVSTRHANFIVTRPGASAEDVIELVRRVHEMVRRATGVDLRPEVTLAGSAGAWWR